MKHQDQGLNELYNILEPSGMEQINTIDILKAAVQNNPSAWTELGAAYRATRQFSESISVYKQAIIANPGEYAAYEMLAEVFHVRAEHQNSIKILENSPREGFETEALARLGCAHRPFDEAKAIHCFERSVELNPDFASPYKRLADIYVLRGEQDRAIEMYMLNIEDAGRMDL